MKLKTTYEVLSSVIRGGAYANLALNDMKEESERAFVTRLVYGVLEHYFELDAVISALSDKRPKPEIRVLLLQGLYCLKYTDMPAYAVVNETVELCKASKFPAAAGFVNSVLNRAAKGEYTLPAKGKKADEIRYNLPYRMIELIKKEYPRAFGRILEAPPREEEHIRFAIDAEKETAQCAVCEKTLTGYYVQNTSEIKSLYAQGKITYQSFTSTLAVLALGEVRGKKVLDLCAAPGGKSVFLAERGAEVTACDIYPHRVKLIDDYAKRMRVDIKSVAHDGTKPKDDWIGAFDAVLVDAPCSGLGALGRRRDIILHRKPEDIYELVKLQKSLLSAAALCVKPQGSLVYSTCTILKEENAAVVADFLANNSSFILDPIPLPYNNKGELQFLPDGKGMEGFYIARMKKTEGEKEC